jgi:peptidoglycan-N-acetylglucosamine deacetylase
MSRKLATVIGTATAAVLVLGSLIAAAVGHRTPPQPQAAAVSTPASAPPAIPTVTPSAPATTAGTPASDPTTALAAGNQKVIFLSFDDGPDPVWTPKILHVLRKHGAHATFFELGSMQAAHPGLREQVLADGNTIGSHSITHAQLTAVSAARRHHEIADGPASKCFRPPYGATNPKVRADIRAAGMTQVLWDIDPRDWSRPGTTAIVTNVLHHAHRGAIVLLHDGGGNRAQTVAALDHLLPTLKSHGYTFPAMNC